MAYAFTLCTGIMRFLVWIPGDRPGKAVSRLCGDPTKIMKCRCSCRAVSADSARKSYGASAASVQNLRGDDAVTMRALYYYLKSLRYP